MNKGQSSRGTLGPGRSCGAWSCFKALDSTLSEMEALKSPEGEMAALDAMLRVDW